MKKGILIAAAGVAVIAAAIVAYVLIARSGKPDADMTAAPKRANAAVVESRRQKYLLAYQHLWREAAYSEIREKANQGDTLAQRRLYEIYGDCMAYSQALRTYMNTLDQLAALKVDMKPTVNAIKETRKRNCGPEGAGREANAEYYAFWIQQSAKRGDLVSQIRLLSITKQQLNPSQMAQLIRNAADSGDPNAIFEISSLLTSVQGQWPTPELSPALTGQNAQDAWTVAACRAGMDCRKGSRLMDSICITLLACTQTDYENYLFSAPNKRQQVESVVSLIRSQFLQSGLSTVPSAGSSK